MTDQSYLAQRRCAGKAQSIRRKRIVAVAAGTVLLAACQADKQPQKAALSPEDAFLVANASAPGVVLLPGIQYKVLKAGPENGAHPRRGSIVKVQYEGRLVNDAVFDSSYARNEPAEFPLRRLITGWQAIVPLMRPGDLWEVYIPAAMAYGEKGAGDGRIPPNSTLIFKIELLGFRDEES